MGERCGRARLRSILLMMLCIVTGLAGVSIVTAAGFEQGWRWGDRNHHVWLGMYGGLVVFGHQSTDALDPRGGSANRFERPRIQPMRPTWRWRGNDTLFSSNGEWVVPLWLPIMALAGAWAVGCRKHPVKSGHCSACGYDTRGPVGPRRLTCPECGACAEGGV